MSTFINEREIMEAALHYVNRDEIINIIRADIDAIYDEAANIHRMGCGDYVDEGTELNNAVDILEEFLNDRKKYKRKLIAKKNVVCGLIERKTITLFNPDKLHVGKPYLITFVEDISVGYDGDSFSFSANTSHTGIFLRGNENFISFVMIGPSDYPIIVALKPDMLFYIQEYKIDEE